MAAACISVLALAGPGAAATDSDDIVVSATVAAQVEINAGSDINFGSLALGASATELAHPVRVIANDQYDLSVSRTGALPVSMRVSGTGNPDAPNTAVIAPFTAFTALGADAQFAERSSDITPAPPVGDVWGVDFETTIPAWFQAGTIASTVTFTAVTVH